MLPDTPDEILKKRHAKKRLVVFAGQGRCCCSEEKNIFIAALALADMKTKGEVNREKFRP